MSEANRLVAGRYRLGTRLGSGAMGVVWQAQDERLHRTVAVKQLLLQPGLPAEQAEQMRQRALREGRIAARLQHAGAVTVHDVVTDEGDPWLIMEYLPSQSLAGVLADRGALPPHEVAAIGAQCAAALSAAHAAGIVHRDIKPGNVLLGEDGVVKITDFGISRAIGDITVTATGILAGTPAYLAPELAQGAEPAPPSDVYSLGATLYTAVEGDPPCGRSDNQLALLHAVAAGRLNPPRMAGPLTAVLMSVLRTNPLERPSMANTREALAAVAAGRVVPAALLSAPAPDAQSTGPTQPAHRSIPVAAPPREHTGTRLDAAGPGSRPAPGPESGPPRGTMRAPAPVASAAPAPAAVREPARGGAGLRRVLLTVLAIALAVAAGIGVASLFLPDGDGGAATGRHGVLTEGAAGGTPGVPVQETAQVEQVPAPRAPHGKAPHGKAPHGKAARKQASPVVPDGEVRDTVREYYKLLPEHSTAAWRMLSPSQQRSSGSLDEYRRFWSGIESVKAKGITPAGPGTAEVELRFTTADGKRKTEEVYSLTVGRQGGELVITDSALVSVGG